MWNYEMKASEEEEKKNSINVKISNILMNVLKTFQF